MAVLVQREAEQRSFRCCRRGFLRSRCARQCGRVQFSNSVAFAALCIGLVRDKGDGASATKWRRVAVALRAGLDMMIDLNNSLLRLNNRHFISARTCPRRAFIARLTPRANVRPPGGMPCRRRARTAAARSGRCPPALCSRRRPVAASLRSHGHLHVALLRSVCRLVKRGGRGCPYAVEEDLDRDPLIPGGHGPSTRCPRCCPSAASIVGGLGRQLAPRWHPAPARRIESRAADCSKGACFLPPSHRAPPPIAADLGTHDDVRGGRRAPARPSARWWCRVVRLGPPVEAPWSKAGSHVTSSP